ncbi:MAG TPA: hypothetical protein VGL86_22235 [Polyangia bacterium]|jgi:hypothetical protein
MSRNLSAGALFALLAACGPAPPKLSNATSLACPFPGMLPFRLKSYDFVESANKQLAAAEMTSKDQASDTLGLPTGARASVYLDDSSMPDGSAVDYHGEKARTSPTQGLFSDPLPGENVSLWSYDGAAWQALGRTLTDGNGVYDLPATNFVAANGTAVYSVLEGDSSCAAHYDYLWPAGTKFVVFDIDGTLTTSDNELILQLTDESYTPMMMTAATTLVQTWAQKGYAIVYLTARPHVYRAETRAWLAQLGFPSGPVITTNGTNDPQTYKTIWLNRMIGNFGWTAEAAYGNAVTDIGAYAAAGIATDVTFIIGPVGGQSGTVAIPNDDYTDHIASFVDAQPDAS